MKKYIYIVLFILFAGFSVHAEENLRVVSLSPSLTEIVFQLGKGSCLVGRSAVCNYPEKVSQIPVAGNLGSPYLEKLAALKPSVLMVSMFQDPSIRKTVENMGIKVLVVPIDSIDCYYSGVKELGKLLDCEAVAEKEIERVKTGLKKFNGNIRNTVPEKRPLVYLEVWNNPLMTVGGKSFINDFINYAGGKNVAGNEAKDYFTCSEEWVILSNPDIIISPSMGKEQMKDILKRSGWTGITAIKNKRVYLALNQDLIYRLGPRVLEGIELINKCIYTEKEGEGKGVSAN